MSDWREEILENLLQDDRPLIIALDPDALVLEEGIQQAILNRGYDIVSYNDPFSFRIVYESEYRERLERWRDNPVKLIVRFPHDRRGSVPFDLLRDGSCVTVRINDIFPLFSYPVVRLLEPVYYDALYESAKNYRGERMGDAKTREYILKTVFRIAPDEIRDPTDLVSLLCRIHYERKVVPEELVNHCLEIWTRLGIGKEEIRPLFNRDRFMNYLQSQWVRYINASDTSEIHFDHQEIRLYVETFFLEGSLKPIEADDPATLPEWATCGIIRDPLADARRHLRNLLSKISESIPGENARYADWKQIARLWAGAIVIRGKLHTSLHRGESEEFDRLHLSIESAFRDWLLAHFKSLPNQPYLPAPVMVHHIPHFIAHELARNGGRIALIVIDGMAIDQWLIIKEALGNEFSYREDSVYAWVPTITSISRRSLFAGETPAFIEHTLGGGTDEERLWRRFWSGSSGFERLSVGFSKGHHLINQSEVDELLHDAMPSILGLVVNTIDNLMHRTTMGTPELHSDIRLWLEKSVFPDLLAGLLERGYAVYITADHGNVSAEGVGRLSQGLLVEETSARARLYDRAVFMEQAHSKYPEDSFAWEGDYLGTGHSVLIADALKAFSDPGKEVVSHGGVSIEEVIVPFIRVMRVQ